MHAAILEPGTSHSDPVVPILIALVFLSLGAVIAGRVMTSFKQPAVLGELLIGVLAGNAGYWLGNAGLTVLREGDHLRKNLRSGTDRFLHSGASCLTAVAAVFLVSSLGIAIGIGITSKLVRRLSGDGIQNLKLLFGLGFAFRLAWLANQGGLAIIVGAFAAGMILNDFFDKELEGESLHQLCRRSNPWSSPLFCVDGYSGQTRSTGHSRHFNRWLCAHRRRHSRQTSQRFRLPPSMNRWAVGIGMMSRGEVGLIFAGIGKGIGVIDDGLFSAIGILVMVTTLLAPILLRFALGSNPVRV